MSIQAGELASFYFLCFGTFKFYEVAYVSEGWLWDKLKMQI